MDLLKERIARHLTEIRERKGMTQDQVAREVGVTTRQYQRWEGAMSTPYWRNIEALAEALGVSPTEIVDYQADGKGPPQETREARLMRDMAELEARVAGLSERLARTEELNAARAEAYDRLAKAEDRIKALETRKRAAR